MELISAEDLFENDDVTIMRTKLRFDEGYVICIDIGIKDSEGDIVKIINVKHTVIYEAYI